MNIKEKWMAEVLKVPAGRGQFGERLLSSWQVSYVRTGHVLATFNVRDTAQFFCHHINEGTKMGGF